MRIFTHLDSWHWEYWHPQCLVCLPIPGEPSLVGAFNYFLMENKRFLGEEISGWLG